MHGEQQTTTFEFLRRKRIWKLEDGTWWILFVSSSCLIILREPRLLFSGSRTWIRDVHAILQLYWIQRPRRVLWYHLNFRVVRWVAKWIVMYQILRQNDNNFVKYSMGHLDHLDSFPCYIPSPVDTGTMSSWKTIVVRLVPISEPAMRLAWYSRTLRRSRGPRTNICTKRKISRMPE